MYPHEWNLKAQSDGKKWIVEEYNVALLCKN